MLTWVFVGGEGCESKGGARGGRAATKTVSDQGIPHTQRCPRHSGFGRLLLVYNLPKIYDKRQSADCYPEVLPQSLFFEFSGVSGVASR